MAWIGGLIAAGGAVLSSSMSANASNNAGGDMAQAAQESAAAQLGMYRQTRADLLPYMTSGNAALSQLDALMGINADPAKFAPPTLNDMTLADAQRYLKETGQGVITPKEMGNMGPTVSTSNPGNLPISVGSGSDYGTPIGSSGGGYSGGYNGGAGNTPVLTGGDPGLAWQQYKHGGPFNSRNTRAFVVGEAGPEIIHLAPGAKGFVEPNGPRANAAAYGHSPIPHRLGGGPIGGPRIFGSGMFGYKPLASSHGGGGGDTMTGHNGAQFNLGTGGADAGQHYGGAPGLPITTRTPLTVAPGTGGSGPSLAAKPMGPTPLATTNPTTPGHPSYGKDPLPTPSSGSGAWSPTSGNNTALPGSGQTPAQIMAQAPEYQFVEQQGIQGLDNSAAASGGLLSGGNIKNILNYSQNLASEQYQNIYNNLMGVTSLGESAGAMVGNSGTYAGMGMGNALMQGGQAMAGAAVGSANAWANGMGNLGFMYAMNPKMFGGGTGG